MLSLKVDNKDMVLEDIDRNELHKIVKWFENSDAHRYKIAMGIDKPITYEDLYEKYLEVLVSAHEFFLSISLCGEMVGFIKGRVDYKDEGEVWIMAMFLDGLHQNTGIGKRALELIINEFKLKLGFSQFFACIVEDNIQAKAFWEGCGFIRYRQSKGYFTIENKSRDLIIMQKKF